MRTNSIIYQIDTFTDQLFKGNPAGVMIVDDQLTEEWMQQMAAEMNLSETAYVVPKGNEFEIRYFTPTIEIPLCGHATLASAHVLYKLGIKQQDEKITFHSKAGTLNVSKTGNWISMNFPTYPFQKIETPATFQELIGFNPIETYSSSYGWVIAVASSEKEVVSAQPCFEQLAVAGLGHLMITALSHRVDFVVRCFAPSAGINEDPVTGSAQCALVPLWYSKTGNTNFTVEQLSLRGGELLVALQQNRVIIKGKCRTVFTAQLEH